MARPSPSARVDSKNTVSPIAIAVTIESASSPRAPVDAAANAPTPAVERRHTMDDRWALSRRQLLRTMAGAGVVAAADLAWWEEPLVRPGRAWGAQPVRFQFSVPEPKRTALVESLAQRFNQAQKDFEVKV